MPVNMSKAKALCTKPELALVSQSAATKIGSLTPAQLKSNVKRARALRDKYATLASRQRRMIRGKEARASRKPAESNENTLAKRDLFADVLERFQAKLDRHEAGEAKRTPGPRGERRERKAAKAHKRTSRRAKRRSAPADEVETPAPRPAPRRSAAAARTLAAAMGAPAPFGSPLHNGLHPTALVAKSKATQGVRAQRIQQQRNLPKILGHVSSRTRRNQAKRDSRGNA